MNRLIVLIFVVAAWVCPTALSANNTPDVAEKPVRILVLGDSLSAGYGLPAEESFPERLERALLDRGYLVRVSNISVSGDTTAGGLARLDWALAEPPDIAIIELGGNDALRGIDPRQARRNLDAIIARLKEEGAAVLLAGMRAPRNLGDAYVRQFDAIFPELATEHDVLLYPFFLEGVAGDPALNQPDGIHPNAAGVTRIVERILPFVIELLTAHSTTAQ